MCRFFAELLSLHRSNQPHRFDCLKFLSSLLTDSSSADSNEIACSDPLWNRYHDLLYLRLRTAVFFEYLLDVHAIDAVLLMCGISDEESTSSASFRNDNTDSESYLRAKRDRISELTLLKGVDSTVLERLLLAWISGIRFLDTCSNPLDDLAKPPTMEICIRLCECIARIFSKLNLIGGESFNVLITNGGLQQDIAAILLRYFCGHIHSRLVRSVDDQFKVLLGVFFDLGD